MVFGNISHLQDFSWLEDGVRECFAYLKSHDLASCEAGRHEIGGERLFVNVAEYVTADEGERFWEAHRQYLDVHVMLDGTERVDLNFIENMEQGGYVQQDDFLALEGGENASVILKRGDFLICYPNDGHRTGVACGEPGKVKKAIFKVAVRSEG